MSGYCNKILFVTSNEYILKIEKISNHNIILQLIEKKKSMTAI